MKTIALIPSVFCSVLISFGASGVKDLNTPRAFPKIDGKKEWELRAKEIREHVLASCGLWPLPASTPLNAKVFGRVDRDGYSVEKAYFETYPGFYLAGNLYRPLGKGNGPFPGILNPHGHWDNGRLADTESGSIAARCISFARQGMVAFSYDMVGYNDSKTEANHRSFAINPTNQLWSISLMGLQTWNSIRALDFLESLPDVDKNKLACTGESGGGTQTFMLGAIEDRLAAQAPVVMVSHSMQGGCLCENSPGLRVDYSNMEIAAAPAPRPQILVAATGDWTKKTMEVEGPAIASIYQLLKKPDHLRYVIFNYDHNYNQTSREAVYEWFGQWLLKEKDTAKLKETPYKKEADADLLVFPDGKLPAGALKEPELLSRLVATYRHELEEIRPKDKKSLDEWKQAMEPLWRHNLQLHPKTTASKGEKEAAQFTVTRSDGASEIPCRILSPAKGKSKIVAIVLHPDGLRAVLGAGDKAPGLAGSLVENGAQVLAMDAYLTGPRFDESVSKSRDHLKNFFTTYNRTDLQERVADVQAVCDYVRKNLSSSKIILVGQERAGLWALAAAPLADGVIADLGQFDESSDEKLLDRNIFFPGYRRLGGLQGIVTLAAPHPLLLHNRGTVQLEWLSPLYKELKQEPRLKISESKLDDATIAQWLITQKI